MTQLNNREILQHLLVEEKIGVLSLWIDEEVVPSLLPFCIFESARQVIVHVSGLARHTRGLTQELPFSFLIHASGELANDPLQIPRLSLQGNARRLEKGKSEYEAARQTYLRKFPSADITFTLGDFQLFALEFTTGRLVAGFARAQNISSEALSSLSLENPLHKD